VGKRGDAKEKRTRKYSSRRRKKETLYIYKKRRRRNGTRYIAPPQKNPQNERPFLFSCPWPSALITRYKTLGADIVSVLVNSNFGDLSLAVRPSVRPPVCVYSSFVEGEGKRKVTGRKKNVWRTQKESRAYFTGI
jgi:hypothetical protein